MMIPLPSLVIEIASSALRLFNHPRVDGHEIINNRFIDSSPKRRKIVNQIIFACKINGDADDNTRVVDSSPPSRANTFKAPSKMSTRRWARSRGTILRRGGDRDSPLIDCGRKKKKGGGGSINSDALEIPLLPFENASNAWLVLILGHESFKIKQFRFMSIDLIRIYRDCNRKKIIFVWFYEFVLLNFGNKDRIFCSHS